jgi:hypothetical protein
MKSRSWLPRCTSRALETPQLLARRRRLRPRRPRAARRAHPPIPLHRPPPPPRAAVAGIKSRGYKVMCYFEAGTWVQGPLDQGQQPLPQRLPPLCEGPALRGPLHQRTVARHHGARCAQHHQEDPGPGRHQGLRRGEGAAAGVGGGRRVARGQRQLCATARRTQRAAGPLTPTSAPPPPPPPPRPRPRPPPGRARQRAGL